MKKREGKGKEEKRLKKTRNKKKEGMIGDKKGEGKKIEGKV